MSVAPGASNALTITVNGTVDPAATGNIVNTATVTAGAGSTDTTPGQQRDRHRHPGAGVADLMITKTDGQAAYVAGTPITYTVTVTNAGPSNANAFDISDVVPSASPAWA